MLNVTTLPSPNLYSTPLLTMGIAILTLKLKKKKSYLIGKFILNFYLKNKNTTQQKAYSLTAEPGSLSNQPCSFSEVTTSGGDVHP